MLLKKRKTFPSQLTGEHIPQHFIALTAHFITPSWKLQSACLGVDELKSHAAQRQQEKIDDILEKYKYKREKCVAFIVDKTAVMPAIASLLKIPYFGWFSHAINLVVHHGLKSEAFVNILTKMITVKHYLMTSYISTFEFQSV